MAVEYSDLLQVWRDLPVSAADAPPLPAEDAARLARSEARAEYLDARERRRLTRHKIDSPITIIGVNKHLQGVEQPMRATTFDVSRRGVGFVCENLPRRDLLVIVFELSDGHVATLAERCWHRKLPLGKYKVGARLIQRLVDPRILEDLQL